MNYDERYTSFRRYSMHWSVRFRRCRMLTRYLLTIRRIRRLIDVIGASRIRIRSFWNSIEKTIPTKSNWLVRNINILSKLWRNHFQNRRQYCKNIRCCWTRRLIERFNGVFHLPWDLGSTAFNIDVVEEEGPICDFGRKGPISKGAARTFSKWGRQKVGIIIFSMFTVALWRVKVAGVVNAICKCMIF